MTTAVAGAAPPPAGLGPPSGRAVRIDGVGWDGYRLLLRAFAGNSGVRLTYDRGKLEIVSPTFRHESYAGALGKFVTFLCLGLKRPLVSGGSMTLRRRRWQRGVEPDRCFWIASAHRLFGRPDIDLRTDPPPDLVIEVDVTHRSIKRLPIYARLGVPEVWRLAADRLAFLRLDGRKYEPTLRSINIPEVTPADLMTFLADLRPVADEAAVMARFQEWAARLPRPAGGTP